MMTSEPRIRALVELNEEEQIVRRINYLETPASSVIKSRDVDFNCKPISVPRQWSRPYYSTTRLDTVTDDSVAPK